jgi:acid phosphatase
MASPTRATRPSHAIGTPYSTLPAVKRPFPGTHNPPELSSIPSLEDLPNRPFAIDTVRPGATIDTYHRDLTHSFYAHRSQIHGGSNDRFALFSNAGGFVMGHYSAGSLQETNLWKLASAYTLLDNFFQGAFGGSFFNHMWLVCACAPIWPDPPDELRSQVDAEGVVVQDRRVTAASDGDYAVNTTQSIFLNDGNQGGNLLPPQTMPTIGDKLSEKRIDWAAGTASSRQTAPKRRATN